MKIWLVTTGSSDVQLKTDDDWNEWYRAIKSDCYNLPIKPIRAVENEDEPYRIAPRVLGMAYQAYPDEVWDTLEFPLLKEFTAKLHDEAIAQIFLLLTDQSQIFDETQRDDLKCPYWQDTYEILPIFERYFQIHFPDTELVPLKISPNLGETGLDDWNAVLDLVRSKLKEISVDPTTIYVSHQAGTPAISSAVQFSSLARFRNDVQFLVSNEYDRQIHPIPRSTYLRGLELQEAKALLDRYDYLGVKTLLNSYVKCGDIQILLNAAILWNFAEFGEFATELQKLSGQELQDLAQEVKERSQHWWWTAYEAAYLGVVRLKQGNTVEAMFHSFRAFEGLAIKDAERHGISGKFGRKAFKSLKHRKQAEWNRHPYIKTLIDLDTPEDQRNDLLDRRNNLFHQLKGFQKDHLFEAWASDEFHWQEKCLGCLNFISDETFEFLDKEDLDRRVASLMVQVHQELERAIAAL